MKPLFTQMLAIARYTVVILALMPLTPATAAEKLVIVLDASNSMWGQINATPKVTLARNGLETLLAQQPAQAPIGLLAYGNRRKSDCTDINVIARPGERDMPSLLQAINGIAPYGRSPISAALEQAAGLLAGTGNILLVSDGPESCDGDPCATAKHLKADNPGLRIHVLSFRGSSNNSLHCLAENSGGQFALMQDAGQLAGQLLMQASATTNGEAPKSGKADAPVDSTPGNLRLSAGAAGSTESLPASFLIYTADGDHVASFTARTEVSQPLPPGEYQVNMLWQADKQVQNIQVKPGLTLDQRFNLGFLGKLRLEAQNARQQAVDANFTLYSPTGEYLTEHLFKSRTSDILPSGTYRIKASIGDESQEARLDVTADAETTHVFQFGITQ